MKITKQTIISLTLVVLGIIFGSSPALATESSWQNLNPSFESGLSGTVSNCSTLSVSNGSVAAYPACTITCNSGYTLSGSSCVASGGGGGGGGSTVSSCSSISYSDWGACSGSFQYRQVSSRTPSSCSLTTAQQLSLQRACVVDSSPTQITNDSGQTPVSSGSGSVSAPQVSPGSQTSDIDVTAVMDQERALVQKTNTALTNRLSGRILLQVEEKGEAWYVEPTTKEKHFMGRPVDAFSMMHKFGLGISNANFAKFTASGVPARFAGRIFIKVEEAGEAYYVNPVDLKMHYLGRPDDAFRIMKELALGISNDNLRQIQVAD